MDLNLWIQLLILMFCSIIILAADYYEILGVKRDASEKEIKKKFRQLGKKIIIIKDYLCIDCFSSIEVSSR